MAYTISFRKRAAKEYLNALSWYNKRSLQAADNLVLIVNETLNKIQDQPDRFPITYKNFHEARTKSYPFSIVYFIDEKNQMIIVSAFFHKKRNPERKFR